MKCSGALLLCLMTIGTVQAAEGDWRVRGDTTLRLDRHEERGNPRLSRYPHTGTHVFQDFNVQLSGRTRVREYWELNVSGVLSESDYRSREDGFTPEWLHLRHENSAAAIPFRIDLGDQHAHFSPLTLDRRLQAARVELQPAQSADSSQSLVWISGRDRINWRGEPIGSDDTYHGASWLLQDTDLGRYAINVVQASPGDRDTHSTLPDDTQLVASLAAAWEMVVCRQQLATEAEWAWQDGQAVADGPESDRGMRVRMSGTDQKLPLNYEFRYERYGRGFKPAGVNPGRAPGMADSRSMGATGSWHFGSGLEFRAGFNRYVDSASYRPLKVNDWNLRLFAPASFGQVPWLDQELTMRLRDRENSLGTIDTRSRDVRWNIRTNGNERSSTQLQFRWWAMQDHASGDFAHVERQVSLSHTRHLQLGPVELTMTPGVDFRERTGSGDVTVASPTLVFNARSQGHHAGLRLGHREFTRPDGPALEEYSLKLDYRYHAREHTFGVELDHLLREPEAGEGLESWRAGVYWRYNFDFAL